MDSETSVTSGASNSREANPSSNKRPRKAARHRARVLQLVILMRIRPVELRPQVRQEIQVTQVTQAGILAGIPGTKKWGLVGTTGRRRPRNSSSTGATLRACTLGWVAPECRLVTGPRV